VEDKAGDGESVQSPTSKSSVGNKSLTVVESALLAQGECARKKRSF
jgi:hypothetical protein